MQSLDGAACGLSDPRIFEVNTYPEANTALSVCKTCSVVNRCMEFVRPSKSFFDGVAAGTLWRGGYVVHLDNSTRQDRLLSRRSKVESLKGVQNESNSEETL